MIEARIHSPHGPGICPAAAVGSMAFFSVCEYSLQLEIEPNQEVVCDRNRNESYPGMEAQ